MKLVTVMSTAALVLTPVAGLAQAPANGAENTKGQPGVVEKVIETVTGHSPGTKEGADAKNGAQDSAAKSAGSTDYPDYSKVKKTGK
jgi:hypothetical protein